jgi:Tfp pilus assembly protein PilF
VFSKTAENVFRLLRTVVLCLSLPMGAAAAPRLPADEGEILERLSLIRDSPQAAALRELRARVAAAPGEPGPAAALARRYFGLAMAEGDPRFVGYAQAALRPWSDNEAPPAILIVRAMLRQYRHEFDGALADLALALQRNPQNAEAHAWRAAIFMVRAEYGQAAEACAALTAQEDSLQAAGCSAYVEATTGRTRGAYDKLRTALAARVDASAGERLWVSTRLAEMAHRLGDAAAAEAHFRAALALDVGDNFLLAAYADFLLAQARAREAAALLRAHGRSDTLLLRLALATRALGLPEAERHTRTLGERFAAAALRGERLHLAEEARYLLDLRGDARAALAAAAENWKTQREPRDALVLLEAARAAGAPAAAAPVLEWLERSGFEHAGMRRLAAELR